MGLPLSQQKKLGLLDDASIFIGFTSLPMGTEANLNDELIAFLNSHKNRNLENMPYSKISRIKINYNNLFYNPTTFYVFGSFDLALLSLIDDFDFGTQGFHPFDPLYPKDSEMGRTKKGDTDEDGDAGRRHFSHHLIVGPAPCWRIGNDNIVKLSQECFLPNTHLGTNKPRQLPLIGICQLKLNNELLIGTGGDYLRCVIRMIKSYYDGKCSSIAGTKSKLKIIILESWSWHELVLLLFSDSFNRIQGFISDICEFTINNLLSNINDADVRDRINNNTLIKNLIMKTLGANPFCKLDYNSWHLFLNSTTTLGFRFELFRAGNVDNAPDHLESIDSDDKVYPFSRWYSFCGHLKTGAGIIVGKSPKESMNRGLLCAGRGDIVWPRHKPFNTKKFINDVIIARTRENLRSHFVSLNSILSFNPISLVSNRKSDKNIVDIEQHYPLLTGEIKKHISIPISKIRNLLYVPVRQNIISKVVAERIYNTISLFNEGIDDLFLFNSFLELLPFINQFIEIINDKIIEMRETNNNVSKIISIINRLINIFEGAWRNRYYASYRLGDINDFCLEYKGGIQQLATAFDGAYKILSQGLLGNHSLLTIIGGDPNISSNNQSLVLNYYDIFKPEFFVSRALHELGETLIHTLSNQYKFQYSSIFNLITEDINNNKSFESPGIAKQKNKIIKFMREKNYLHIFFSDIFGDLCSKRLAYGEDIDLFLYWHRNIALTNSVFWRYLGVEKRYLRTSTSNDGFYFRDEIVNIYLVRLFIQVILSKPNLNEKDHLKYIHKYWRHYKEIDLSKLCAIRETALQLLNSRCVRAGIAQMNELINNRVKEWPGSINLSPDLPIPPVSNYPWILNHLAVGAVESIQLHDAAQPYHYLLSLFRAYLEIIKDLSLGNVYLNHDIDPLLYRNSDNFTIWNEAGKIHFSQGPKIYYDRRGGTFLTDPIVRRKYFKIRSAFFRSLWDLVLKWKYWMPELDELLMRKIM